MALFVPRRRCHGAHVRVACHAAPQRVRCPLHHPFARRRCARRGIRPAAKDQFIAALLHDAVEDQGGLSTLERIRAGFGDCVAEYVQACSDAVTSPKPPWRERKTAHLADMARSEPGIKLILAADKLHNARAIMADLHTVGNAVWDRFNGGKRRHPLVLCGGGPCSWPTMATSPARRIGTHSLESQRIGPRHTIKR